MQKAISRIKILEGNSNFEVRKTAYRGLKQRNKVNNHFSQHQKRKWNKYLFIL